MVTLKQNELSQFLEGENTPPPGSPISWASFTHCGLVRQENEDAICIETGPENDEAPRYLFAIADGLGGHQAGAVASRLALTVIQEEFHKWPSGANDRFISKAMRAANQEVYNSANSTPELFKMQTTLTTVMVNKTR